MSSKVMTAIRIGARRGIIEFRRSLTAPGDVGYYVFGSVIFVVAMYFQRRNELEGTGLTVAHVMFPSVMAMVVVFGAAYGLATLVATEREDGTLLRAKSVPHGMAGYVTGQAVRTTAEAAFSLTTIVVPTIILIDDPWSHPWRSPLIVVLFAVLGLLASIPLGFVIGSVFKNPRAVGGWGFIIMGLLIWVSGIFAPVTRFPEWVHPLATSLPLYWLGHGMRSAVLPEGAAVAELGGEWQILEAVLVLAGWAAVSLLLAPVFLRRMARRESGSAVSARRDKALSRV